jgi:hypothetical protein
MSNCQLTSAHWACRFRVSPIVVVSPRSGGAIYDLDWRHRGISATAGERS